MADCDNSTPADLPASATFLKPFIVPVINPLLTVHPINVPYTTNIPKIDDSDLLSIFESSLSLVCTAILIASHINSTDEIDTSAFAILPEL